LKGYADTTTAPPRQQYTIITFDTVT